MSIEKGRAELSKERVYTDTIIRNTQGRDMMAMVNLHYEQISDLPAPGSSVKASRGHTHDSMGNGRGILRVVNGGCYVVDSVNDGPPYEFLKATAPYQNIVNGSSNYYANGSDEVLGIAYVSPGIAYIRMAVCFGCSSIADSPFFRIFNITDTKYSAAVSITSTDPTWYDAGTEVEITRTSTNIGETRRIELAIEVALSTGTTTTFYLYHAYPYEYTDGLA